MPRQPQRPQRSQRPQQQQQTRRPKYPTPQTDTVPVVTTSSRLWRYLYHDPRSRLVLASAIIATAYFIFRVIDAIALYSRIVSLIEPLIASPDISARSSAWSTFMLSIPKVHYITLILGMILNWVAWRLRRPWAVLGTIVLYVICAIAYIGWAVFLLPEIALCAIGYMALVRRHQSWI